MFRLCDGSRRIFDRLRIRSLTVARPLALTQLGHHPLDDGFDPGRVHPQPSLALSYFSSPPTSRVSTMAMITPSQGRLSVYTVWRAALPVA